MALDILAAPASQAFVKRIFSECGLMTSGVHNRMKKSLKMRFCFKLNKNFLKDSRSWLKPLLSRVKSL